MSFKATTYYKVRFFEERIHPLFNLKTKPQKETNIPGIFAAGDIVRGASLVVWAIKDGRDVALSIQKYLELKKINKIKAA